MEFLFAVLFVLNFVLYFFNRLIPNLKILQLEEYDIKRLLKFNIKNKKILLTSDIIILLLSVFYFLFFNQLIVLISLISSLGINCIIFKYKRGHPKYTKRIKRILIIFLLLVFVTMYLSILYQILTILCLFVTIVCEMLTIISNFIVKIYECILLVFYLNSAKKKLNKSNLIKIAIVGSYGKTSVKNILCTLLKEKYSVLMTPESYNTPSGLALTINNNHLSKYQILIMEMGAKKPGDISTLCKYFKPDYAIFTAIGKQHLQTFGTIEKIIKTKSEILNYVDTCVFNCDNDYVKDIYYNFLGDKIGVGKNFDVSHLNEILTFKGSKFDILHKGKILSTANTELIGEHNVKNILLAVAMAIKLKLTPEQISIGIRNLKPVKSRMEKIVLSSGVTIINNGYNSNPDSAKSLIKLMKLFDGKKRTMITPGFVEMGKHQNELNYDLGKLIAQNVDECIIVNKVNSSAIKRGLIDNGFYNFKEVDNFKSIDFSKFNENDILLIENDLPENYV